jgi:hypothetical protein
MIWISVAAVSDRRIWGAVAAATWFRRLAETNLLSVDACAACPETSRSWGFLATANELMLAMRFARVQHDSSSHGAFGARP